MRPAQEAAEGKNVEIFGANTAQQCLSSGLLDEIIIHLVPVLLGDGVTSPNLTLTGNNTYSGVTTLASGTLSVSQLANINTNLSTNVSFTVFAASSGPITYQWRLNGTNIPGATNLRPSVGDRSARPERRSFDRLCIGVRSLPELVQWLCRDESNLQP